MFTKKFNPLGLALLCSNMPTKELRKYFDAPNEGMFLHTYCKGTAQDFRQKKIIVAVAEKMISEAKGTLLELFVELCSFQEKAVGLPQSDSEIELEIAINGMRPLRKVVVPQKWEAKGGGLNPLGRAMLLANASVRILWQYFGAKNQNQYNVFCRAEADAMGKNIPVLTDMIIQAKGTVLHHFIEVCKFQAEAINQPLTDTELYIIAIISKMDLKVIKVENEVEQASEIEPANEKM